MYSFPGSGANDPMQVEQGSEGLQLNGSISGMLKVIDELQAEGTILTRYQPGKY